MGLANVVGAIVVVIAVAVSGVAVVVAVSGVLVTVVVSGALAVVVVSSVRDTVVVVVESADAIVAVEIVVVTVSVVDDTIAMDGSGMASVMLSGVPLIFVKKGSENGALSSKPPNTGIAVSFFSESESLLFLTKDRGGVNSMVPSELVFSVTVTVSVSSSFAVVVGISVVVVDGSGVVIAAAGSVLIVVVVGLTVVVVNSPYTATVADVKNESTGRSVRG